MGTRSTTIGTKCNDVIVGCPFSPINAGLGGCPTGDLLRRLGKDDILQGSEGNDVVYGDEGNDKLTGGGGISLLRNSVFNGGENPYTPEYDRDNIKEKKKKIAEAIASFNN